MRSRQRALPTAMAIWCMLETPRGILDARAIAAATPRVGALVMGTSDLTKDLRARHTRDRQPLLTSLGLCVLAARAAGVAALDGVHLDLDDDAGLAAACRQAADMGFDGKTLIHPKQIDAANQRLRPHRRRGRLGATGGGRARRGATRRGAASSCWTAASSRTSTSRTRIA